MAVGVIASNGGKEYRLTHCPFLVVGSFFILAYNVQLNEYAFQLLEAVKFPVCNVLSEGSVRIFIFSACCGEYFIRWNSNYLSVP